MRGALLSILVLSLVPLTAGGASCAVEAQGSICVGEAVHTDLRCQGDDNVDVTFGVSQADDECDTVDVTISGHETRDDRDDVDVSLLSSSETEDEGDLVDVNVGSDEADDRSDIVDVTVDGDEGRSGWETDHYDLLDVSVGSRERGDQDVIDVSVGGSETEDYWELLDVGVLTAESCDEQDTIDVEVGMANAPCGGDDEGDDFPIGVPIANPGPLPPIGPPGTGTGCLVRVLNGCMGGPAIGILPCTSDNVDVNAGAGSEQYNDSCDTVDVTVFGSEYGDHGDAVDVSYRASEDNDGGDLVDVHAQGWEYGDSGDGVDVSIWNQEQCDGPDMVDVEVLRVHGCDAGSPDLVRVDVPWPFF